MRIVRKFKDETQKQEDTFDQIGSALGDLKHMSHVRPPLMAGPSCAEHEHVEVPRLYCSFAYSGGLA